MSDTSGLPNADAEGVPAEDRPERFEEGAAGDEQGAAGDAEGAAGDRDAQAAEPAETEPGQAGDLTDPGAPATSPGGAEDVSAGGESDTAEPPPAGFDPADHPSNPDLVARTEPPD
ncbi:MULTISPECIES: hypothetical protein [unclassified Leifsonia]|uniref:hypothetical protein n=1 Tax=unclassified Leifsonia TaxID=2663824 RepID=UPI0008A72C4D|nr:MULTISPECIES: hypothetical protein [unclassified Leifsonia]SEI05990.1 hypothetical protein SAMN04515694_11252 [Leifsonia sp. CL154]SFL77576.1 hypothetical protein SAMN04515692_11252 [Leifsonia sp. CL147]